MLANELDVRYVLRNIKAVPCIKHVASEVHTQKRDIVMQRGRVNDDVCGVNLLCCEASLSFITFNSCLMC